MIRRLRLTAATVCFALAIALVALLVRSYWTMDFVGNSAPINSPDNLASLSSSDLTVTIGWRLQASQSLSRNWTYVSQPSSRFNNLVDPRWKLRPVAGWLGDVRRAEVWLPHWVLALSFAAAGLLLANGRAAFSLRTALIATTAFALLLGLHVGLQRAFSG